jgi:hypothetical protein
MAIFHLAHRFVRRSNGSSSLATAAYNAGQKLQDSKGSEADYSRKGGILFDEISLPSGSRAWANNRGELWRRLEAREDQSTRRKDAILAHNFDIALPHELTLEQNIFLARDFVREQFTRKGYAVDWAIHAPDPRGDSRNIHLHVLVPLRKIEGETFGNKARYTKNQLRQQNIAWRRAWATLTNRHLKRYGHKAKIDERSLLAQGIQRTPTRHKGKRIKAKRALLDFLRTKQPPQPLAPIVRTTKQNGSDGSITVRKMISRSALSHIGKGYNSATYQGNVWEAPVRPVRTWPDKGARNAVNLEPRPGGIPPSVLNRTILGSGDKTSVPARADLPVPALNPTHRKGWPPEAIAAWNAWGSKNPQRFFALWPELAPDGFKFGGGLQP